jgi:hypothetical protein
MMPRKKSFTGAFQGRKAVYEVRRFGVLDVHGINDNLLAPVFQIVRDFREEPTGHVAGRPRSLLPGLNRVWVNAQELGKHGLAHRKKAPDFPNIIRLEFWQREHEAIGSYGERLSFPQRLNRLPW